MAQTRGFCSKYELGIDERRRLYEWLNEQDILVRNLQRDCSTALPIVQLLKKYFPRLVDVNNYPSGTSQKIRLGNWELLNRKVLSKLGLKRCDNILQKYVMGSENEILQLLNDIRLRIPAETYIQQGIDIDNNVILREVRSVVPGKIYTVTLKTFVNNKFDGDPISHRHKMIAYPVFEKLVKNMEVKGNQISLLTQKLVHMEQLLQLKDERIRELVTECKRVYQKIESDLLSKNHANQVTALN